MLTGSGKQKVIFVFLILDAPCISSLTEETRLAWDQIMRVEKRRRKEEKKVCVCVCEREREREREREKQTNKQTNKQNEEKRLR